MAQDQEKFLSRWARRKQESKRQESALPEKRDDRKEEPAPALPPVERLTPEADFSPFMHPKVTDALRRVALKKLFADPHFNLPDPFEAYSGDWTGGEPIPDEMLKTLAQARNVLFPEEQRREAKDEAQQVAQHREADQQDDNASEQDDDASRKDA